MSVVRVQQALLKIIGEGTVECPLRAVVSIRSRISFRSIRRTFFIWGCFSGLEAVIEKELPIDHGFGSDVRSKTRGIQRITGNGQPEDL